MSGGWERPVPKAAPRQSSASPFHCPAREAPEASAEPRDSWSPLWSAPSPALPAHAITWRWHWTPLVCSHCGGISPEDATRLLAEGWEIEQSVNRVYQILHPPGYWQCHADMMRVLQSGGIENWERPLGQWTPRPPALACSLHFSQEQQACFWDTQQRVASGFGMAQ